MDVKNAFISKIELKYQIVKYRSLMTKGEVSPACLRRHVFDEFAVTQLHLRKLDLNHITRGYVNLVAKSIAFNFTC